MSEEGKQLLAFVKDIRSLCRQAAELLEAVDDRLFQEGWELATSQNIAFANGSTSLQRPELWFPYELFRFYHNRTARPSRMAFTSVLLDDDRDGDYLIGQPLATAGWFDFPPGTSPPPVASGFWWWSRFHGYMPTRRDDGSLHAVSPQEAWPREVARDAADYPFQRVSTFGIPLVEITSPELLQERLIAPLLTGLAKAAPAAQVA